MSDIVDTLRETARHNFAYREECNAAADEIERLREYREAAIKEFAADQELIERLRGLLRAIANREFDNEEECAWHAAKALSAADQPDEPR